MSEIAVVHMDLMAKGGGEAVAINTIEALQRDHDVTLLTLTDPDLPALNEFFNASVDPAALSVRQAGHLGPALHEHFGYKHYILQNALLGRYARRHADEFDLLVSTINELGLEADSVQYIHFPFDWAVNSTSRGDIFHPSVEEDSFYERLCTWVADVKLEDIQTNTLFANSSYTAHVVEEAYGTRPEVLYPPVDTSDFTYRPWESCENGFVTVGRIERSKRLAELIEIIDGVQSRGHEVHLHIVGPTIDDTYYHEVAGMASERSYVELEGELPRSGLVDLICNHRYGIHGKEYEHFGMAVAELAAGGALVFVPANGGQRAIVNDDDRLEFDGVSDAVETIDRVLSDPDAVQSLRFTAEEVEQRFGRARFKERINAAVESILELSAADAGRRESKRKVAPVADGGD